MSISDVIQAQALHQETLLARSNVVGVAVGRKNLTGDLALVTLVQQKMPLSALSADELIPKRLDGVLTDVIEVGYLRAYQATDPKGRFRPTIPCGVSIGHYKITAGTLGAIVTDRQTGEKLILSNNHVLANSNNALVGDAILQPGFADSGQNPADVIAKLERFVRLRYTDDPPTPTPTPTPDGGGTGSGCDIVEVIVRLANLLASVLGSSKRVTSTAPSAMAAPTPAAQPQALDNEMDCALAKPIDPNMFTSDILNIGKVSGTKPVTLGMRIRKSGRTTGYTESTINLLNATVSVAYGSKTARFTGQVVAGPMSQGGDSGSLIVDGTENKAVGLLFAGSNLSTIFTPIDKVLDALKVSI
jgi:hypothetical protein